MLAIILIFYAIARLAIRFLIAFLTIVIPVIITVLFYHLWKKRGRLWGLYLSLFIILVPVAAAVSVQAVISFARYCLTFDLFW